MQKLDRQDWAVGAAFRAYGVRIGVRANTDRALQAVVETLPPGASRSESAEVDLLYSVIDGESRPVKGFRKYSLAYANTVELARFRAFEHIPGTIERHLSITVAERATTRLFIHAGVVGWKGKAVLIPGRTRAGKSTLVTALVHAGAAYYSDEFALVDNAGRLHPYPHPIQLRNGDGTNHRLQPDDLAGGVGKAPLRVGLILLTQHQKHAQWRPRRVSAGEGMLSILTNTISAQREPARALRGLTAMLAGATILKGPRGEAESMVGSLLRARHLPAHSWS